MKTSLSIIVPVFQDTWRSQTLIQSLNAQELSSAIEVIFCCTNVEEHQQQTLRQALHTPINVVVLESLHPGIGKAQNLGIRTAQSEWLLFLDDDCALPHPHYIQNTINLTQSGHKAFCGTYLNAPNTPLLSAFYNYLSHLWLMSFQSHPQSSMLIGGCFLASKPLLLQQHAYFDEHNSLAGEEIPVAQKLLHNFTQIRFTPSLSVIHDTRCTTHGLLKKAWNHGRALTNNRSALPQKKESLFSTKLFHTLWLVYVFFLFYCCSYLSEECL